MNSDPNRFRASLISRIVLLAAALLLVSGCDQQQLPVGAALQISPTTRNFVVPDRSDASGACYLDERIYVDQPVVLSMTNSDGAPLGGAEVSVYVDWSGITYPGTPALAIYDDRRGNNDGVADDFELVSGVGDTVVKVNTDYYGGDRPLLLRINLSCSYRGQLFAFSDGITAQSDIEVSNEAAVGEVTEAGEQ